jgi:hypothetical protein
LLGVVLPGVGWVKKLILPVLVALAWIAGYSSTSPLTLGVGLESPSWVTRVNPTHPIMCLLVIGWVLIGTGYAYAKTHRAVPKVADHLVSDDENRAIRLVVGCEGYGEINLAVSVCDLRDVDGNRILPEAVEGLVLRWTGTGTQPTDRSVLREGDRKQSVTVFHNTENGLHLYGIHHHQPVDHRLSSAQRKRLWIKLMFNDKEDRCPSIVKWFAIDREESSPCGYRPAQVEQPLPQFCG